MTSRDRPPVPRRRPPGWVTAALAAVLVAGAAAAWLAIAGAPGSARDRAAPAGAASTAAPPPTAPASSPVSPPVRVCGNKAVLGGGPRSAPPGAIAVPAGDNSGVGWSRPHQTYWFAPGVHTLGPGQYTQIIPGAGAAYVGAPGAVVDGLHANFYAFGGSAPDVTIRYLTIRNFGTRGGNQDQGVVNHGSAPGWTISHSTLTGNAGAGTMLGSRNTLSFDCLQGNGQYGFNAYAPGGLSGLVLDHNEIAGNDTYNWEARDPGCGCTGGGKFWDVRGAAVVDNWVHGNRSVGLWADTNNRGFRIEGNYIEGNFGPGLVYEISYNALIAHNTFVRNGLGAGPANPGFPTGAIYVSESGSDSRVPGPYGRVFAITGNTFTDNWGGVVLWESADRFCNSPSNTSTGFCTLVSPAVTVHSCNRQNITRQPYYGDCRWKTQHVLVSHNVFDFDPAAVGPSCTPAKECGFQGIFSQYGTYPSWSPYKGTAVEKHVTFQQDNHFTDNVYHGPWRFMALAQGNEVSWARWQGHYQQDTGSTLDPHPGS